MMLLGEEILDGVTLVYAHVSMEFLAVQHICCHFVILQNDCLWTEFGWFKIRKLWEASVFYSLWSHQLNPQVWDVCYQEKEEL